MRRKHQRQHAEVQFLEHGQRSRHVLQRVLALLGSQGGPIVKKAVELGQGLRRNLDMGLDLLRRVPRPGRTGQVPPAHEAQDKAGSKVVPHKAFLMPVGGPSGGQEGSAGSDFGPFKAFVRMASA